VKDRAQVWDEMPPITNSPINPVAEPSVFTCEAPGLFSKIALRANAMALHRNIERQVA
jgi:hypothetical protein